MLLPAIVKSEFIFDQLPTPSCHASTIAEVRSGELVAAWFGGTHEGHPDVGIWVSRSVAGVWTKPVEVAVGNPGEARTYSCYNPVLFQPKHGPLLLFYKVGRSPGTWWGMMKTSADEGRSWSEPKRLPAGILGPIKNRPIELPGGTLLCPSSSEDHGWRIHFESTSDLGKTWSTTGPLNEPRFIDAIQPSILRLGEEKLRAVGRTRQGKLFAIDSPDLGTTWGEMRLLDVPNPNSGADAITLRDGRYLLVYNEATTKRTPLNIAVSTDAETWKSLLTLENTPGEFSYPTVIQTTDGLVHITYTWNRVKIKHVVIDPDKLALKTEPR